MNEIKLPYADIKYEEPIVYFVYKEGAELGFPEIRELISCAEKISGKKPYVTFADVRTNVSITNEGKRIISDMKNMPLFRGTAALVNNNVYKHAANFLNRTNGTNEILDLLCRNDKGFGEAKKRKVAKSRDLSFQVERTSSSSNFPISRLKYEISRLQSVFYGKK